MAKQQKKNPTTSTSVRNGKEGGGHSARALARMNRLERRRAAKFRKHKIEIITRRESVRIQDQTVHFTHMVLAGKTPLGRTTNYRYALKKAHQHCRNIVQAA